MNVTGDRMDGISYAKSPPPPPFFGTLMLWCLIPLVTIRFGSNQSNFICLWKTSEEEMRKQQRTSRGRSRHNDSGGMDDRYTYRPRPKSVPPNRGYSSSSARGTSRGYATTNHNNNSHTPNGSNKRPRHSFEGRGYNNNSSSSSNGKRRHSYEGRR